MSVGGVRRELIGDKGRVYNGRAFGVRRCCCIDNACAKHRWNDLFVENRCSHPASAFRVRAGRGYWLVVASMY